MTRIVWNDYIKSQIHWAERMAKIASETDNGTADALRAHSDRAFTNAGVAIANSIGVLLAPSQPLGRAGK